MGDRNENGRVASLKMFLFILNIGIILLMMVLFLLIMVICNQVAITMITPGNSTTISSPGQKEIASQTD